MYDWSKESTIRLIEYYHAYPILWNPKHSQFKDEAKKKDAWTEISLLMKSERAEVERKMRSLIFQYNREKKKRTEKKLGDNTEFIRTNKRWYGMSTMSFLSNCSRPTSPTMMKTEEESKTVAPSELKLQYSRRRISTRHGLQKDSSIMKRPDITSKQGSFVRTNRRIVTKKSSNTLSPSKTSITSKKATLKNGRKLIKKKQEDLVHEGSQNIKPTQPKKQTRDEYQIYGEHIACKMRKLPTKYSKVTVEHYINNIIHQAELGQYNQPPTVKSSFGTSPTSIRSKSFRSTSYVSSAASASQEKGSMRGSMTYAKKEPSLVSDESGVAIDGGNADIAVKGHMT